MIKRDELNDPNSCLNRAKDDELIFVLLGHDVASPAGIRAWADERVRRGKNKASDSQIVSALEDAIRMQSEEPAPRHPFEVRISIGGDDWEYVTRTLRELASHVEEHGPICSLISGGGGGCHSIDIAKRDISVVDYHKELQAWHEGIKRPATQLPQGEERA